MFKTAGHTTDIIGRHLAVILAGTLPTGSVVVIVSSISLTGRQLLTASAGVPGQLVVHGQHHRQQSPRHTRNDQAMVTLMGQID
ncbi:hypothetical protein C0Q70_14032 [Pomacea canaliculata]|uniref:Uncharacterized protein n=1 Tax=Pomacea canaliculata TaxID=400727 RepID=A0A2T7NYV8_POMCA|nr:hypothetical protein C0Q70_14032 [Pomacea canaliculata]